MNMCIVCHKWKTYREALQKEGLCMSDVKFIFDTNVSKHYNTHTNIKII